MEANSGTQCPTGNGPLAVKLSSTRDPRYFYVNWWLTDHCNWDCSYCHDILKRGDLPFPKLDHAKDFVDQISEFCRKLNKKIFLDITGGEVTEYPFLDDLLVHAKNHDSYTKIRTNASRSVEDFQKILESIDVIEIEFHPEHTQTSHFMLCLNAAAQKENLLVSVNLNALPERFHEVEDLEIKIKEKWPDFNVKLKMLFDDPVSNTKPMVYQEPQKIKFKRQSGSMILDYGEEQEFTDYQTLILEDKNRFEEWSCNIGIEQIIVDAYGVVRRGHCRQGGSIGSLGNPLRLDGLTVTCKKSHCVNGFDILATKIKSV